MTAPATPRAPVHPALPAAAWTVVALLWFAGGSNYLTRTMLTTMRGSVVHDIPMTNAQFGLLTSAFLWVYALVSPFGGFLADRFSRRLVIVGSVLAWSLVTLLTAYAKSFDEFIVLRALLGLGQAFYIPAAVALIVDFHVGPTRAFATGLHLTGLVLGSTIGGLGGWLAETHSWNFAYLTIALPSLGLGIILFFFLRDPPPAVPASPAAPAGGAAGVSLGTALRSLAGSRAFHYLVLCQTVQGAVSWVIIGWMPTVVREQFNLGQGSAGFSTLGFLYIPQLTGLLVGGYWSDRWSASNPRARIIVPALAIMAGTPLFLAMAWANQIALFFVSLAFYGVAMGFLGANTMAIVCLTVDTRFRSTAMGTINACTAIAGGVAIYGVGALRDASFGVGLILTITALGVLLCGWLLWLVNTTLRKAGAPQPALAPAASRAP